MSKILIIDNSLRDRQRMSEALSNFECQCESQIPEPNVLGGFNLVILGGEQSLLSDLSKVRANYNGPVIVIVSALDINMVARTKALGVKDVLLRPIDLLKLPEIVQKATRSDESPASKLVEVLRRTIRGNAPSFLNALQQLASAILATDRKPILIVGENGTGKELFAQAVNQSSRPEQMVSLNMAAIPKDLVESELFGHKKGSFTGATEDKVGAFERVGNGVLFLDEIGEASLELQAKLLRVINQRRFSRVGDGGTERAFEGRLVTATNRNLELQVAESRFREDLYHRLSVFVVQVPSLRQRMEDLPELINYLLGRSQETKGRSISREAMSVLAQYTFPGNVRELENLLVSAVAKAEGSAIGISDLPIEQMSARMHYQVEEVRAESGYSWPSDLLNMQYKEAMAELEKAFCKEYLPQVLASNRHKVLPSARSCGLDDKTFRKKWRDAGLPPLS